MAKGGLVTASAFAPAVALIFLGRGLKKEEAQYILAKRLALVAHVTTLLISIRPGTFHVIVTTTQ